MVAKVCSNPKCTNKNPVFTKDSSRKDGLKSYCTKCIAERNTRYLCGGTSYKGLLRKQGKRCLICGRGPSSTRLHADHDHSHCPGKIGCSKCIRGLLCFSCNSGLGNFKDSELLLLAAIRYLKRFRKRRTP